MKKLILLFSAIALFTGLINAQKSNLQIKIIAEIGVPDMRNKIGLGGFLKGEYRICHSTELTLMTGVSKFNAGTSDHLETIVRVVPVLAGYKKIVKRFYLEPQIGYGELGGRVDIGGDFSRPSVGAFIWAVGAGYEYKRVSLGIRYQSAHGAEGTAAGTWHNKTFDYTGIHAGFNLLRRSK